ncbi:hypothetical protein F383_21598 [Gossypium arboreum]|uniref:Uncharacterized protein n=1 Tax=Gossypium arboreum TaxID=29729 RepID=A0A0B0NNH4_GOSAR|nr:hypothetical protein F383_21598 [Gossypium arboreum]
MCGRVRPRLDVGVDL